MTLDFADAAFTGGIALNVLNSGHISAPTPYSSNLGVNF